MTGYKTQEKDDRNPNGTGGARTIDPDEYTRGERNDMEGRSIKGT